MTASPPGAVSTMQKFTDANQAGLVGGDCNIQYSQSDTDDVKEILRASAKPLDPSWPPRPGTATRLGSGTGDRGTLGPATLWRRALHDCAPLPWQFSSGTPIRIVGDLIWWKVAHEHLGAPVAILPMVIGNYFSHPGDQAEFRSDDEHHLLSSEGIKMDWYTLGRIITEQR